MNLTFWPIYLRACKGRRTDSFEIFSRANARYSLACGVQPLQVVGLTAASSDAYYAALRVTLAYSALEALENAIGENRQNQIQQPDIAKHMRNPKNKILKDSLSEIGKGSKREPRLLKRLNSFFNGESEDLRPAIYAIRNLMCHGTFTANRMGLIQSKNRRDLVHALADQTLLTTDLRFTDFVQKIEGS